MKVAVRKLRPDDTDWEKLLGVQVFSPLLLVLLLAHHFQLFPPCLFLCMTGRPCPTCGAIHAWNELVRGNVLRALSVQPLMTVIEIGTLLFMTYSWVVVIFDLPRIRVGKKQAGAWVAVLILLLALNWIYIL